MAGTTGSSGLNNFLSDTQQVQTTLPSWYDTAQQNIVNQAGTALGQAPAFQNTVAQGAVNTLQGANNPFTQAQGTLNQIASGAANPWITDPTTGQVSPNTQTALGGLFSAQNQQLNQLLPQLTAPTEAGNIGSGNFGSLRGQTAMNTASANAFDQLAAQQMQSALQNQSTGATAANALGNVGTQGIQAGLTAGTAQMNAPFQGIGNYSNLVNAINAPTTVSAQNQTAPLSQIGALSNALGSTGAVNSLLGTLGINGGLSGLATSIGNLFGSSTPTDYTNGVTTAPNGQSVLAEDANGNTTNSLGQVFDANGNYISG